MDNAISEAISQAFYKGILGGFWTAFKLMWWFFPLAIVFKIFEKWANRKIDNWKKQRRIKKGFNCPWCGGNLVERIGKFGKFLGCSNYPKCQHTENINK